MEANSAFRVFWKSRQLYTREPTADSEYEVPLTWKRKHFKRKKKRPSKEVSEKHSPVQDCDEMITFPCSICKREVGLPGVFLHKKRHVALNTLGLQWTGERRPGLSAIMDQRQSVITKLLSSFAFNEKTLQSINNAFELLWKRQVPAYYRIMENICESSIHPQKISHLLIKGAAICNDRNATWRVDMNDKFIVVNNFGSKPNVCFFGLFDGHHGASAADLTSTELPVLLLHQLSRLDPSYQMTPEEQKVINSFNTVFREDYRAIEDSFSSKKKRTKGMKSVYENIHKAFAKAFWRMDRLLRLGRREVSRVRWSGCSAVTCVLESNAESPEARKSWGRISDLGALADRHLCSGMPKITTGVLHVANAGNVQAVLCRNGKGFRLTKEHTTRNADERRRVLGQGAAISANAPHGLLQGKRTTTRGLGFHGDLKLKKFIIPAPQTISVPIDDLCQFLILGTDGLWDVLDTKEVTALTMSAFQAHRETRGPAAGNKPSPPRGSPLCPNSEQTTSKSEPNIHTVFQCKSAECVSTVNSKENLSVSKHSICDPESSGLFPPKMTTRDPCSEEGTDGRTSVEREPRDSREEQRGLGSQHFYDGAAAYISHELVKAALAAGSRDNVTVMVMLLSGTEHQLLT
ncbi:protein phosphatase 2C-like domain-containing protein 1 [Cervus elaphus]|uniref:protein phosphatase 2C-like domain-containing protein 1 n=1 Tax=Cervus elaphus TaxID=9860 RepID=UPI001CC2802F|nr:protein phosphatase 2C-like domain-containing protein 1 [Cervus elaphus]